MIRVVSETRPGRASTSSPLQVRERVRWDFGICQLSGKRDPCRQARTVRRYRVPCRRPRQRCR